MVLVSTAIAIAMGATAMADIAILGHLALVLGAAPSGSTDKEKAAPTWKKGYGFHPLAAWCMNTRECLDMMLRAGSAGSNTFTDHKEVLDRAIRQVPARYRKKILVRIDGAGASHKLIEYLLTLSTRRKTLLFTCGWTILEADEEAIAALPEGAWKPGVRQDGTAEDKDVAEITHLMSRAGIWPEGLRFIARRVKPSRRHEKNMTAFERKTGWKYSITCSNIPLTGMEEVPGSHHPQFIDVLQHDHATVETGGVRTAKAMGLRNLPSKTWQVSKGWVLAANIAADLTAWARLLGFRDQPDLRDAEPDTLRYRVWHLPARLVRHARKRTLKISPDWPWKDAFLTCWQRVCVIPRPADQHEPSRRHGRRPSPDWPWKPVPTRAHRAASHATRQNRNGHEAQKQAWLRNVRGGRGA